MKTGIKITSIANCGLFIETDKAKVLFDGLNGRYECFSEVPAAVANDIINGDGIFRDLNFMLFTHCHIDHFDSSKVLKCAVNGCLQGLFLPDGQRSEIEELKRRVIERKIPLVEPSAERSDTNAIQVINMKISYFKTEHAGENTPPVPHYSFLVETEGKAVYISGDSDYYDNTQVELLKGINISAAFYNPLHLGSSSGRAIIRQINAARNYIYHLPSEDSDLFRMRKQAVNNLSKYKEVLPACRLILNEMEEVIV